MNPLARLNDWMEPYFPGTVSRSLCQLVGGAAIAQWAVSLWRPDFAAVMRAHGALSLDGALGRGEAWQLFTAPLINTGPGGLLFAVFSIWMFGSAVEGRLGTRRLWVFAALSAALVGGAHLAYARWLWSRSGDPYFLALPMAGFYAMGLALAGAAWRLLPAGTTFVGLGIPFELRTMAAIVSGLAVLLVYRGGGHQAATLSGLLAGAVLAQWPGILTLFGGSGGGGPRRGPPRGHAKLSRGHAGRDSSPDSLYDDPHWRLDQ